MLARIQHFAIVSENFVREAKFYESVFGMKRSKSGSAEEEKAIRTNYAVSISDGYVGVTMIGRKPGYVLALIASCRHGQFQFSSPDGVFIDISVEQ
jgi:predicted enzyme related to lactoylglutathione lyase